MLDAKIKERENEDNAAGRSQFMSRGKDFEGLSDLKHGLKKVKARKGF